MSFIKKLASPVWNNFILPIGESIVAREAQRRGSHESLDYRRWRSEEMPRFHKFHNLHRDEDCFIIGNGPSLNQMDLSKLMPFHSFGLNKIHLLFERIKINLSYHVAVNPLVLEQSLQDFTYLNCPSFLSFTSSPKPANRNENWHYLYTSGAPLSFTGNLKDRISEGWTVTFVAMQIAYYMGFQNVFLIGCDHSFKATGAPNERQTLAGIDENHFSPNYFGGKEWHLPDLEGSEMAYRLAKFGFERAGRKIYDATVNGKLDIFPKLCFDESVKRCRPRDAAKNLTSD